MVARVEPMRAPAGWHPDPTGRFEFRYFNGERWTSDVSVNGQRYIDELRSPTGLQPGWELPGHGSRANSRGLAIASFVVGLVSLLIAWAPFAFLFAAVGAITAIVFGTIALGRVKRKEGAGRRFAIWGVVLSVVALGLCVVGFLLTVTVVHEFHDFFNEGPHTEHVESCTTKDGLVSMTGTITNRDDVAHDYVVDVSYRSGGDLLDTDHVAVHDVAPGATEPFEASAFVSLTATVDSASGLVIDDPTVVCVIDDVTGPEPFSD